MVNLARSKHDRPPPVEPSSRSKKGKKAKRRHSTVVVNETSEPGMAIVVNDPTIVPTNPRLAANDIWHFFVKGKDGGKTVCCVCL